MKTSSLLPLALALGALAAHADGPAPAPLPDPLDLKGAIVYALDHNFPILQAREQVRVQEGLVLQAQAPGIPNVTGNGNYQRNAASEPGSFVPQTTAWQAQLRVTQTLFAGGGIHAAVRNAKLTREAVLADLQATVNAALLDVRTRFYAVLLAREQVRVQEQNIALIQSQLTDTQHQFQAGAVSNFEVLRAEVALANAQPDLITARNNERISVEQLRQSLGAPGSLGGGAPFPALSGNLDVTRQDFDLENAVAQAHQNRPELLSLTKRSDAGDQALTTARSGYYPNVGVFAGYSWSETDLAAAPTLGLPGGSSFTGHGWLAGAQGNWSIFDGRATAGRVVQAKAQLRQAKLSESQEDLAVEIEVRQAFSAWQEASDLVTATQKTVDQATEALRLADNRFKAGTATQLDVLTSQVALTQARTNAIQANYNYLVAVATLRKAMGQGDALVGG
ncbi:MAG TPA: TolC family protein [Opitutaceae bacterium]|jgi:outer membrane protein TolC|nr:TolC family protein [Opitutaceae bacterium]